MPKDDPAVLIELAAEVGAVGYRSFADRLEPKKLRLIERSMLKRVGAQPRDYRYWDDIRTWAADIGAGLPDPTLAGIRGTGRFRGEPAITPYPGRLGERTNVRKSTVNG